MSVGAGRVAGCAVPAIAAEAVLVENVLSDLISSRSWPAVLARIDSHPAEASMPSSTDDERAAAHVAVVGMRGVAASDRDRPGEGEASGPTGGKTGVSGPSSPELVLPETPSGRRRIVAPAAPAGQEQGGGGASAFDGSASGGGGGGRVKDSDGNAVGGGGMDLPLHELCRVRDPPAPVHVVEALIGSYPDGTATADRRGRLPLHLALMSFPADNTTREARSASSSSAMMTPHAPTAPIDTVRALVEAYPRGVRSAVGGGGSARPSGLSPIVSASPEVAASVAATPPERSGDEGQAQGRGGDSGSGESGSTAAASSGGSVVDANNTNSTTTTMAGSVGTLPLHLAVKHGAEADVVEYVLARHPRAARERDECGRTPVDYLPSYDDFDVDERPGRRHRRRDWNSGSNSGTGTDTSSDDESSSSISEADRSRSDIWSRQRLGASGSRRCRHWCTVDEVRSVLDRAPSYLLAAEAAVDAARSDFAAQLRTNIETHIAQVTKLQIGRKQTEERLRADLDIALKNVHYLSEELSAVRSRTEREVAEERESARAARRDLDDERGRNARLLRATRELEWDAAEQRGRAEMTEEKLRHALDKMQRHAAEALSRAERLSSELDQSQLNENALATRTAHLERQLDMMSTRIFDLEEAERDQRQSKVDVQRDLRRAEEELHVTKAKLEDTEKEVTSLKADLAKDPTMKEEDRIRLQAFEWAAQEDAQSRIASRVKRLQDLVRTAQGGSGTWAESVGDAMACVRELHPDDASGTYNVSAAAAVGGRLAATGNPALAAAIAASASPDAIGAIDGDTVDVTDLPPPPMPQRNTAGGFPTLLSAYTSSGEVASVGSAGVKKERRTKSPPLPNFPEDRYAVKPQAVAVTPTIDSVVAKKVSANDTLATSDTEARECAASEHTEIWETETLHDAKATDEERWRKGRSNSGKADTAVQAEGFEIAIPRHRHSWTEGDHAQTGGGDIRSSSSSGSSKSMPVRLSSSSSSYSRRFPAPLTSTPPRKTLTERRPPPLHTPPRRAALPVDTTATSLRQTVTTTLADESREFANAVKGTTTNTTPPRTIHRSSSPSLLSGMYPLHTPQASKDDDSSSGGGSAGKQVAKAKYSPDSVMASPGGLKLS